MATEVAGPGLFAAFLKRHNIAIRRAGDVFDVAHVTILDWREGRKSPSDEHKRAIERWTSGEVPFDSWLTEEQLKDRGVLAQVQPFAGETPTGTGDP